MDRKDSDKPKSKIGQQARFSFLLRLFRKRNNVPNDALTFHGFFQRSDKFKTFFNTPEKTEVFYIKIRCGLLHQGQTKGKSLIHIRKNEPMLKWISENNHEDGVSIHRRLFVEEIKVIYEKYISELQKPHNLNFRRQTLEKKMKYIVEQK